MTRGQWVKQQLLRSITVVMLIAGSGIAVAAPPSFLNMFTRRTVEADPNVEYVLSEENGPWLILAACFGGEQGREQASDLVMELRQDYNLPAYIHQENYDYTRPLMGSGPQPVKMRHLNGRKYDSYAVLVGEFDSLQNPSLEKTLDLIKHAQPKSLDFSKTGKTSQRFAAFRQLQAKLFSKGEENRQKGPMAMAFVSKNPLLPDEFFNAPVVDAFVRSMNEDVEHSLLDNPGKFTVVVRSFGGNATTDFGNGAGASKLVPNPNRLNKGAEQAHKMVVALRAKGVEAYEFHDRYRSIVTVGEFDRLGEEVPGGEFRYAPEILQTMQRYSAGKSIQQASHGTQLAANHIAGIPFDLNPHPIAVPRSSKRSLYAGALGFGG